MTENDAMIAYDREMIFWHQKKSVLDNSAVFVFWRAIQQKKKDCSRLSSTTIFGVIFECIAATHNCDHCLKLKF